MCLILNFPKHRHRLKITKYFSLFEFAAVTQFSVHTLMNTRLMTVMLALQATRLTAC